MKIALVASPYPLTEAPSPPLGITYVAATCLDAGADVAIFDYIVSQYTPKKLRHDIDSFNPDVLGTNSVTMNFLAAAAIIREAKQYKPSIITMMGGPHVSFDIEQTLEQYPEIDLIVVGEGEETLKEILPVINDKSHWHRIKGIAFRDNDQIIVTPQRSLIEDVDSLPMPARHLLPMSRYQALGFPVSIITSRGCPNRCIFCLGRKMVGYKVRHRSPIKVADEIEHLLTYGIDRINVADDTFTANKKLAKELCNEIIRRGLKVGWSAFSRVNTVDIEMLQLMREAGCDCISFGIESGNPEMLKRIRKGITLDQARTAIKYCKEAGIAPHASFIVGLPGENHQTLKDTEEFAESLEIDYGHHMLAPFPGTDVRENINEYDLKILTDDWDQYHANSAIVSTSALSADDMNTFLAEFEKPRRENWERIMQRCTENKGSCEEALNVEGFYRMTLIFKLLSEDIINNHGSFYIDGNDPVQSLAAKIISITNDEPEFTNRTVNSLMNAGYLKYSKEDGHINWYWTHNNRIDRLIPSGI